MDNSRYKIVINKNANYGFYNINDPHDHGAVDILNTVCKLLTDVSAGTQQNSVGIALEYSWKTVAKGIIKQIIQQNQGSADSPCSLISDITFPSASDISNPHAPGEPTLAQEIIFGLKGCIAAFYGILIPDFLTLSIKAAGSGSEVGTVIVRKNSNDKNNEDLDNWKFSSLAISYDTTDNILRHTSNGKSSSGEVSIDPYKASGLSDSRWG